MGEYFYLINLDKGEYVSSYGLSQATGGDESSTGDLSPGMKFFEWSWNMPWIWNFLLHQSDDGGAGGDWDPEDAPDLGRWAGDRVTMVGDYDSSKLYDHAGAHFAEISEKIGPQLVKFKKRLA